MKTLAVLMLAMGFAVAPQAPAQRPYKQARYLMGSVCEITAYGESDATERAVSAAFEEIKRIDGALSNWKPDSALMQLNRAAAAGDARLRPTVPVSDELFERLQKAMTLAEATGGRFDPTVGPLVRAWGFLPGSAGRPSASQLASVRERVGWKKVHLDPEGHTVQFAVPGMEVDFGGVAKGYAAERAAAILRDAGVEAALVSLGDSSLKAVGHPPGREGWPVLVRDPRDGETPAAWIQLGDGEALASSGTYANTVGQGKTRRSHIIDPQTGAALGGALAVTVIMEDAETADALTKFFLLQAAGAHLSYDKWLARFPKASIMLMAARGTGLVRTAAGSEPARFHSLPGSGGDRT